MDDGFLEIIDVLDGEGAAEVIAALSPDEANAVAADWASWAHIGQLPPEGAWRTWVMLGGRGFGKTRAGAEWVTALVAEAEAEGREELRIALVAATIDEARRIMVEGDSGLLNVAGALVERWHPSRRLLRFHGGAEAVLFSGASPEALRGPQHDIAWCDELAKWEKPQETWDMLQFGLRLGERPRALVTTTPRSGPVLGAIMAEPDTVVTGGRTRDNPHTARAFKARVEALYAGTRLGAQELDGVLLPNAAGALWTVELIERLRVPLSGREGLGVGGPSPASSSSESYPPPTPPFQGGEFVRTLIAVDPPSGDGTCGIVACAGDAEGIVHVLADHSVTAYSPEGWTRVVADVAAVHGTREVLAEANQGGKMVKAVLLAADPTLHVRLVNASDGKTARAEPVARACEAGKVRFHGRFPELEAELLGMIAGGGYEGPGSSPDRADAMVWGLNTLLQGRAEVRVRSV